MFINVQLTCGMAFEVNQEHLYKILIKKESLINFAYVYVLAHYNQSPLNSAEKYYIKNFNIIL